MSVVPVAYKTLLLHVDFKKYSFPRNYLYSQLMSISVIAIIEPTIRQIVYEVHFESPFDTPYDITSQEIRDISLKVNYYSIIRAMLRITSFTGNINYCMHFLITVYVSNSPSGHKCVYKENVSQLIQG